MATLNGRDNMTNRCSLAQACPFYQEYSAGSGAGLGDLVERYCHDAKTSRTCQRYQFHQEFGETAHPLIAPNGRTFFPGYTAPGHGLGQTEH